MKFLEQTTLGELDTLLKSIKDTSDRNKCIAEAKEYYNLSARDVLYLQGQRIALDEQSNAATLANNQKAQQIINKYKGKYI